MTDHSDLIAEMRAQLVSLKEAPSATSGINALNWSDKPHRVLYDAIGVGNRALAALSSQSLSLSEAREEIERLKGLLHANGKPRFNEAMRRLEVAELALKPFAEFADVYDADHVRRSGGRPENYDLSDSGSVATGGRRDSETYRVLVVSDLRRAKSALENSKAGLADATPKSPDPSLSSLRKGAEVAVIEAMENDPFVEDAHLSGTTQQDQRIRHYAEVAIAALVSGSREVNTLPQPKP